MRRRGVSKLDGGVGAEETNRGVLECHRHGVLVHFPYDADVIPVGAVENDDAVADLQADEAGSPAPRNARPFLFFAEGPGGKAGVFGREGAIVGAASADVADVAARCKRPQLPGIPSCFSRLNQMVASLMQDSLHIEGLLAPVCPPFLVVGFLGPPGDHTLGDAHPPDDVFHGAGRRGER